MTGFKDGFATTRWTMVLAAGASREVALEELCQSYWFPLYAFVRRRGYGKEDAEDLTQSFFAKLLDRESLTGLDPEQGRFRAFLLAALKNFLSNEWGRSMCAKRGGALAHLSLDWQSADHRFAIADETGLSPDRAFDREWALELLANVIERLRGEFLNDGKDKEFDALKVFLTTGRGEISGEEVAKELGIDAGSARVKIHRLRKRYRELLKREIAETLADRSMVEEELAVLFGAFS
jgi:RNA polymerase sigma factor (sigma-70 family)